MPAEFGNDPRLRALTDDPRPAFVVRRDGSSLLWRNPAAQALIVPPSGPEPSLPAAWAAALQEAAAGLARPGAMQLRQLPLPGREGAHLAVAVRVLDHAGESVLLAVAVSPRSAAPVVEPPADTRGSWRWVSPEPELPAVAAPDAHEADLSRGELPPADAPPLEAREPNPPRPRPAEPDPEQPAPATLPAPTARPGPAGPARFAFRVAGDGRMVVTVPRGEAGLGIEALAAAWNGRRWAEIAEAAGLPPKDALGEALARRATFTACRLDWPAADGHPALVLELSAVPEAEAGPQPGFRGFGIARPVVPEATTRDRAAPDEIVRDGSGPADPASPGAPPIGHDGVAAPGDDGGKIIRLPSRAEVESLAAERRPRLSPSERTAFQEIARALGVRMEGEPHEPTGAAADTPPPSPAEAKGLEGPPTPEFPQPEVSPDERRDGEGAPFSPASAEQNGDRLATIGPAPSSTDSDPGLILRSWPMGALVTRQGRATYANPALLAALGAEEPAAIAVGEAEPGWVELRLAGSVGQALRARSGPADWVGSDAVLHLVAENGPGVEAAQAEADAAAQTLAAQKLAAQKLAASERQREAALRRADSLATALEIAADGVLILEPDGRIASANHAAAALFGTDAQDLGGTDFTQLIAPESRDEVLGRLEGLRRGDLAGLRPDGQEILGRVRQGGTIPLFITLGRLEEGEAPRLAAVIRDLTPARRAEAELLAARERAAAAGVQERIGLKAEAAEVLAGLAREIRAPLSGIVGSAESLIEERFGPLGNERYKAAIRDIAQAGEQVLGLVGDFVDLSRLEAGQFELDLASVALNDVLQQCVAIMQPQASRDRIIIRTSLAGGLPPVIADGRSIRQIALTLLTSSIRVTMPGGQVIVATSLSERGEVVLRIRDTGVGLSERELAGALDPLRAGSEALAGQGSLLGTGLGLPLTRALVEANQAGFSISSSKNAGTIVEIVFPAARVLGA